VDREIAWQILLAMGFAGSGALALARFFGIWPRFDRSSRLVLATASTLASRRGHGVVETIHLALALIADEKVSSELVARGVDVPTLYDELDALLPPSVAPAERVRWSEDAARVIARASNERFLPTTPRHVFFELRHDASVTAKLVARHWAGDAPARDPSSGGPYRGRPAEKAAWVVRIWNDDRTTMEFVVAALHDTIMLREAQAIHAMFVTHYVGSAVVHRCERDEAMRLAKLIGDAASARAFPLRVTAEELGA
jgi:ATP-dependent Clp protease adapter protein ClpS